MKRNFTLTELLVVIAIIAVLAGMTMPALSYARAAGQRTKCINNKSNIIKAMQMYANKNDDVMPYKLGDMPYSCILVGGENRAYKTDYLPKNVLTCTVANVDYNDGDKTENNAVGMLNVVDDDWTTDKWKNLTGDGAVTARQKFGRFVVKTSDNKNIAYAFGRMKNASILPLFADSYLQTDDDPTPKPRWAFKLWTAPANSEDVQAYVAMVHSGQTTVAFADGSARAFSAKGIADESGLNRTLNAELDTITAAF